MQPQQIEKWWAVDDDEPADGERARFAEAMDELMKDNGDRPALPAFLGWLRSTALDQEMYGEWLRSYTEALEPLFDAFEAGWFARSE